MAKKRGRPVGRFGPKDRLLRVRLDAELFELARAAAREDGRSVSFMVRDHLLGELERRGFKV
jgi:hypothetical protein